MTICDVMAKVLSEFNGIPEDINRGNIREFTKLRPDIYDDKRQLSDAESNDALTRYRKAKLELEERDRRIAESVRGVFA